SAAKSNMKPSGGTFSLDLSGQGGSQAEVLTTKDVQVSVALPQGAFASRPGQASIRITVKPLAPPVSPELPDSLVGIGNLVHIQAAYVPGNIPANRLTRSGQVVLFYPPSSDNLLHQHRVLQSADGKSWT